jgi:Fe-S-cluster containining protein
VKACNQCGKCCLRYGDGGLSASSDEIAWWQTFRPEIARYARGGEIWMDPESGNRLSRCPFLEQETRVTGDQNEAVRYTCSIYHDRPDDCRHYPVVVEEMLRDGCEMLELRDLDAPLEAQKQLDLLMADSRPPLS